MVSRSMSGICPDFFLSPKHCSSLHSLSVTRFPVFPFHNCTPAHNAMNAGLLAFSNRTPSHTGCALEKCEKCPFLLSGVQVCTCKPLFWQIALERFLELGAEIPSNPSCLWSDVARRDGHRPEQPCQSVRGKRLAAPPKLSPGTPFEPNQGLDQIGG